MTLADQIQQLFDNPPAEFTDEHREVFNEFKKQLNSGEVRAARKSTANESQCVGETRHPARLRMGRIENFSINNQFRFYDKDTYPLRHFVGTDGIRVVPGGSSIRDGCYIGKA